MGALRGLAVAALALAVVSAAAADRGHEPYISGSVLERVPGKNASNVAIRWNWSCLLDEYGESTYAYTIVLHRLQPAPEQTQTLTRGIARAGGHTLQLPPGRYRADADPFRCETGINLYSDAPERGLPFTVPDYCAFAPNRLDGIVTAGGRRLLIGGRVRPGDAVVAGGAVLLVDELSTEITLKGTAALERGTCATTDGWRWALRRGTMTAKSPSTRARYEIVARRAVTSGVAATWKVTVGKTASVTVTRGRVSVRANGRTTTHARGTFVVD